MRKFSIIVVLALWLSGPFFLESFAGEEPRIPAGVSWGITLEQVQRLAGLDRNEEGTPRHGYVIRGATRDEFVALWQDRLISFYIAKDIGLYAINIDMTPQSIRHTQAVADQELTDIAWYAPIRLAILQKYGPPSGIVQTWDADELTPLSLAENAEMTTMETVAIRWPYARNWLVWEGAETRLALGEQSIWYASQLGLLKRQRQRKDNDEEQERSAERELTRQMNRQQQLEAARAAVPSQAETLLSLF